MWDGLELLSAEHLLFTCHSHPHLTLVSCSNARSVPAPRTLTLELMMQFTCRLSAKYSVSVYSITVEQWLSQRGPHLPRGM